MSSTSAEISVIAASPGDVSYDGDAPEAPPRTYVRQVIIDTFKSYRARFGAAWVALLGFAGVFAPFIASSHPLLMKTDDGGWSSPVLKYLTPVDVILLACTFAAVILVMLRRYPASWRWLTWLAIVLLSIPLCYWLVRPPQTVVYEQYRDWTKEGKIQRAVYAPIPYSANDRQRDVPESGLQPPSRAHLLGTEVNGADVASRMIHAARIAMAIGFIATGIAVIIGVIIGGFMGYYAGTTDILGMRLIEIFEAIPQLFLLLAFVAFFGRNLYIMMAIIGLTSWTPDARFIRAEFLRLRKLDFVQAGIAAGLPLRSILFRHMLPNGISPVLVSASFGIASAILYESTLSFLGLGLVDEPSWGQLLNQALSVGGTFTWWIALFPGLAIFLTVFAYNLVGESLRDALDPRLRGVS
jgi:peptide/nickel transport system permease protein